MAEALVELISNLNMLTNVMLVIVMIVSITMLAYPDPTVRHNGTIVFLVTLLAAVLTNLQIGVV